MHYFRVLISGLPSETGLDGVAASFFVEVAPGALENVPEYVASAGSVRLNHSELDPEALATDDALSLLAIGAAKEALQSEYGWAATDQTAAVRSPGPEPSLIRTTPLLNRDFVKVWWSGSREPIDKQ